MTTVASHQTSTAYRSRALHRFAWLTVAFILVLIFVGGMVKSTNSGLSVPDWPNTYGHFMFFFPLDQMVGGIFWEHSHRMIASVAGLLTFGLTILIWRLEKRKWVKVLAIWTSIAVLVQGIFGGVTVLLGLPAWTSTFHGTLGQSYFCMSLILALALSPRWVDLPAPLKENEFRVSLRTLSLWTVGAILIQLMLGAYMRHIEAGLVIPDFPMMFGKWSLPLSDASLAFANQELRQNGILDKLMLSEVTREHMVAHLAHRFWAVVVTILSLWTAFRIFRHYRGVSVLFRPALLLISLLVLQISLGILTIYTEKQPSVTTFHVMTGAMVFGAAVTIAAQSRRLFASRTQPVRMPSREEGPSSGSRSVQPEEIAA
ncbi:MAG: heme A synthase [Candidatus Kapaibacterium sp.]